jgi:two-component system, cell cycle sensor histidine kinase and response regulator CckA
VSALSILVVDDDPTVNLYTCTVLERAGHRVYAAADLAGAAAVAAATTLDVLVSDVVLGRVDGLDVDEAVRALQPTIRTLFISGYARPRFRTGVEDPVLPKPFAAEDLLERVGALLA